LSILCLQAFNLASKSGSPAFGNSRFDRCRHSPLRYKNPLTKYAIPRKNKPKTLELGVINRRQSYLTTVFILSAAKKKASIESFR